MGYLAFQLCGALLIISCVSANIPISGINIDLNDDPSFEQQVSRAMAATETAIRNIKIASLPSEALGQIPYIGGGAKGAISAFVTAETNKMWRNSLYKAIGDAAHRSDAEAQITNLQAKLKSISQHFNQIRTKRLSEDDVKSKLHVIHNEFMYIINLFANENVVLRKYPQFTIAEFSSISILFAIFEPIRKKYIRNLPTEPLACRLQDQIEEYRKLNVFNRLSGMETLYKNQKSGAHGIQYNTVSTAQPVRRIAEAINQNYNPNGYNGNSIDCQNGPCNDRSSSDSMCIKDTMSDLQFTFGRGNLVCENQFIQLTRHRIENAYDKSKNILNSICTANVRSKRTTTGNGWLKIIFTLAQGTRLASGQLCDQALFAGLMASPCDLYVKLRINGNSEFKTKVKQDQYQAAFFEMYESKKISKDQSYEMKLKDFDPATASETLITANGKIRDLVNQTYKRISSGNSYFDIVIHWRDEYEDEEE